MDFFTFYSSIFLIKKMAIVRSHIDFKNVEKLVQVEAQRKKILWELKSKKLLIGLIVFLLIIIFLME
ncbi:hypothetical protein EV145_103122 [Flavobacterium sp. 245]|nr:hypothetical protein EV145_103122 [Flavobacterium sp. 245]